VPEARKRESFAPGPAGDDEWDDYLAAIRIQRRSEIVLATQWTFVQLDDQDSEEVEKLLLYLVKKRGVEKSKEALTSRR